MLIVALNSEVKLSSQIMHPKIEIKILSSINQTHETEDSCQYLSLPEKKIWEENVGAIVNFLESEHQQLMFVDFSKIRNFDKFWRITNNLATKNLDTIDLLQLKYKARKFKIEKPVYDSLNRMGDIGESLGRNISEIDLVYRNWMVFTRFTFRNTAKLAYLVSRVLPFKIFRSISWKINSLGIVLIAKQEYCLRKFLSLNVPLIYHSFEKSLDCFIISKKFARAILTINSPALLTANRLYSACARTQNLVSIRVGKNLF